MKQMKLKEMMDTNKTDGTDNWERETALNHITFIRDHQKKDVIETLVKDHKSTEMDLEVRPGEPSFLNILISNSSKRADVYSVKIEDPDENILKSQELTLIDNSNNNEWKYWFEQSKCVEPSAWDMIHDSTIYLNASEQCPMLFKFFTYRETIVSLKKSDHNDPLTLAPRKIYVKVFQQSDESLIKCICINIIPRPNPIDHVFRFYEPENSYVTVTLPTFTSIPLSTHPDLFIECSLPWVTSQVIDNNQIQCNFKTPFSPEILSFYVFIYHNSFKDYLLAACHLKVHALTSFFTTVRTGVRKPINIPMFASRKQQSVMVYTDDEVVSEITQRPIALDITQSTNVQLTVKTFLSEQRNVVIHCVDVRSQDVARAYLLQIKSEKPKINQSFVTKCTKGKENWQKLPITNPYDKEIEIEVISSKPNLIIPIKKKLKLQPKESSHIVLCFLAFPRKAKREVFIFVNEALSETSKFNHAYMIEVVYEDP